MPSAVKEMIIKIRQKIPIEVRINFSLSDIFMFNPSRIKVGE